MVGWVWIAAALAGEPIGAMEWQVEVVSVGADASLVSLTADAAGTRAGVRWSGQAREVVAEGGWGAGTWRVGPGGSGYQDQPGQPFRAIEAEDLDAVSPEVRQLLPGLFTARLVDTGRSDTILGVIGREMEVQDSQWVRGPTSVWIADGLTMPTVRLRLSTVGSPITLVTSPLPASLPLDGRVVLRLRTEDQGVQATWTAVVCTPCGSPPPDGAFGPAEFLPAPTGKRHRKQPKG